VTVTDRGPYVAGRVMDLTPKAFRQLFGGLTRGLGQVVVVVPEE
jgi:rare lipoprotein A (peptidoglycan hydrolase)